MSEKKRDQARSSIALEPARDPIRTESPEWVKMLAQTNKRICRERKRAENALGSRLNHGHRCEDDRGVEISCELVVAGRDAVPVLEAVEGSLDQISSFVGSPIEGVETLTRRIVGNDGQRPALMQELAEGIAVVGRVGGTPAAWRKLSEQLSGCSNIPALSRRHLDGDGAPERVADGVDLGRAPAVGAADSLRFRPPFPPAAERCALAVVESML